MGLIGKSVKVRCGPAAVMVSEFTLCHCGSISMGRREGAMSQSQKNCLFIINLFVPTNDGKGVF